MRQYAQEIGDRFVAALAHSYGDAYAFLRSRSNVACWSREQIVVLRDCVERAYQSGRISAETMDKACRLIASLVGDCDDPKTAEITLTPRASTKTAQPAYARKAPLTIRPMRAIANDAIASDTVAVETTLLPEAPSAVRSSALVSWAAPSPCKVVVGVTLRQRYVLEKLIGIGGTALIYRARDLHAASERAQPEQVALKVLHPALQARPHAVERFVSEFRQLQKLSHPGIARVYDLAEDAGTWFMTMELLTGETLLDRLRHRLSRSDALRLIAACGEALAHAHQNGVVHGDLKPSNLFLTDDGALRLLDFGGTVGSHVGEEGMSDGAASVAATPAYASPEVLAGERPEVRDDVFSLACIAYELLTGQHPFGHRRAVDGMRVSARTTSAALSLRDSLALSRGLAWHRLDRPATVAEFLRLLLAPLPALVVPTNIPASVPANVPAPVVVAADTAAATARKRWQRHWRVVGFGVWGVGCLLALLSLSFGDPEPVRQAAGSNVAVAAPIGTTPAEETATQRPTSSPTAAPTPVPAATPPSDTWAPVEPELAPTPLPATTQSGTGATADRAPPVRAVPVSARTDARPAVSIGLEQRQVMVSGRAVAAVITLQRTGSTSGRARVRFRTEPGTARPRQDYESAAAVAEFADGQKMRTLFVPIMQQPAAGSARSFSVALERAPGGPPVGPVTRTTVTILNDG